MQSLNIGRGLALLLVGGLLVSTAAGAQTVDTTNSTGSLAGAASDASGLTEADAETSRNGNRSCVNRFGRDFARAFQQDPNDEPLDTDGLRLRLQPQADPLDVC